MDLTDEIKKISDETKRILENKNISIDKLEWILAQVKEEIYASTLIKS